MRVLDKLNWNTQLGWALSAHIQEYAVNILRSLFNVDGMCYIAGAMKKVVH